ncbi:hypothetical protein [Coleofasciculus sp. G2-EDA-02]|uniref:hypothetical protein n=1 Tax=Coleofasciculus sp. G2-EDA-02 TaxID=3069529 RepID=UPI0032FAE0AA
MKRRRCDGFGADLRLKGEKFFLRMGSRKDITRGSPDLCKSFLSFPGGAIASMRLVAENIF